VGGEIGGTSPSRRCRLARIHRRSAGAAREARGGARLLPTRTGDPRGIVGNRSSRRREIPSRASATCWRSRGSPQRRGSGTSARWPSARKRWTLAIPSALEVLAEVELEERDHEAARTHAERAVTLREAVADAPPEPLATARFLLARALQTDSSQRAPRPCAGRAGPRCLRRARRRRCGREGKGLARGAVSSVAPPIRPSPPPARRARVRAPWVSRAESGRSAAAAAPKPGSGASGGPVSHFSPLALSTHPQRARSAGALAPQTRDRLRSPDLRGFLGDRADICPHARGGCRDPRRPRCRSTPCSA
jgi:hypothetical protein